MGAGRPDLGSQAGLSDFTDAELFAPPPSFMGAPLGLPGAEARAVYLGVPFDCGTNALRIGSRHGPKAVREASANLRRFNATDADFDPIARLGLVDAGDIALTPSHIPEAYARIEAATTRVRPASAVASRSSSGSGRSSPGSSMQGTRAAKARSMP